MPIHKMIQEGVGDWLGNGIIMPVPKSQQSLRGHSQKLDESDHEHNSVNEDVSPSPINNLERQVRDDFEQAVSQLAADKGLASRNKDQQEQAYVYVPPDDQDLHNEQMEPDFYRRELVQMSRQSSSESPRTSTISPLQTAGGASVKPMDSMPETKCHKRNAIT